MDHAAQGQRSIICFSTILCTFIGMISFNEFQNAMLIWISQAHVKKRKDPLKRQTSRKVVSTHSLNNLHNDSGELEAGSTSPIRKEEESKNAAKGSGELIEGEEDDEDEDEMPDDLKELSPDEQQRKLKLR